MREKFVEMCHADSTTNRTGIAAGGNQGSTARGELDMMSIHPAACGRAHEGHSRQRDASLEITISDTAYAHRRDARCDQ